jgi:hypothetical protein
MHRAIITGRGGVRVPVVRGFRGQISAPKNAGGDQKNESGSFEMTCHEKLLF